MKDIKTMKRIMVIIVILIIVMLSGCLESDPKASHEGIVSYSMTTSLGGDAGVTHLTYNLVITNENKSEYFIESINPVLSQKLRTRLIDENTLVAVNKSLQSMESLEIGDVLSFDTAKMTKDEIQELMDELDEYDILFKKSIDVE